VSFSFSNFLKIKRKEEKTPQTSLMMLEANKDNSKVILESSSIKLTTVDEFVISSLNFKHIGM
jgi:hypothetical protein